MSLLITPPPTTQSTQTEVKKHFCTYPGLSWLKGAKGVSVSVRVLTKAQPFVPVPVSRGQQPRIAAAPSLAQPVTRCLGAEQALYIIKAIPEPLLGSPHCLCIYPEICTHYALCICTPQICTHTH